MCDADMRSRPLCQRNRWAYGEYEDRKHTNDASIAFHEHILLHPSLDVVHLDPHQADGKIISH